MAGVDGGRHTLLDGDEDGGSGGIDMGPIVVEGGGMETPTYDAVESLEVSRASPVPSGSPVPPRDAPARTDDTPLVQPQADGLSDTKAGLSLVKTIIGAGSFVLPSALQSSGLLAGVLALFGLAWLAAYTFRQLAHVGATVRRRGGPTPVDAAAHHNHPPTFQDCATILCGPRWGTAVAITIVTTILGVCSVFVDFVAQLLQEVVGDRVSTVSIQLMLLVPLAGLALIRDPKYLAWTAVIGDVAVASGFVVVLWHGLRNHDVGNPFSVSQFRPLTFHKFFGQAAFLFNVHPIVLIIAQSMRREESFPKVANYTMWFVVLTNSAFGAAAYLIYQDETKGLVLDNVKGTASTVLAIALSIDLLFTIPIVMSSSRRILERALVSGQRRIRTKQNAVRLACVVAFVGLAIAVPDVNDLATLVGAVFIPFLSYVMPPLMYLRLHPDTPTWKRVANYVLMAFGVVAGLLTTVLQIRAMAKGEDGGDDVDDDV